MRYESFSRILKKIAKRAGIKKRIHPHMLRHTRATVLASNNVAEYINVQVLRLGHRQRCSEGLPGLVCWGLDKAVDMIYGFEENEKPKLAKPKRCPRCGKINEPTAKYCSVYAFILDEKLRIELEMEKPRIAKEAMSIAMQNPEILSQAKEMVDLVQVARERPEFMQMLRELRDESSKA